jgi:hypothetical protein
MKFFIIVLLLCGIFFYLFFSPVNKERVCYETSQKSLDSITSDIIDKRIPLSTQCGRSADTLYTLETCIREATKSSAIAVKANDMILRIVATVRMSGGNLWTLKADHNEQCASFTQSQLP